MVHVDKGTPGLITGLVRGLSKRAHASRESGRGHAYPFVGGRPGLGDPQRREAPVDACARHESARGDVEAVGVGAAENGRR